MSSFRLLLRIKMLVFRIFVAVFLIAIDALGIMGNFIVVLTISINKRFHVMRYLLFASLAVSDFIIVACTRSSSSRRPSAK